MKPGELPCAMCDLALSLGFTDEGGQEGEGEKKLGVVFSLW